MIKVFAQELGVAPEAHIQFTPGLITDDGEVTDKTTEQFLRDFIEAFDVFITRVLTVLPREGCPPKAIPTHRFSPGSVAGSNPALLATPTGRRGCTPNFGSGSACGAGANASQVRTAGIAGIAVSATVADVVATSRCRLSVDALRVACWRRRPPPGTICHSNQGNTLPGRSGTGCAKPDSSARWVGWPRWITR
jgi:hypothetical protein